MIRKNGRMSTYKPPVITGLSALNGPAGEGDGEDALVGVVSGVELVSGLELVSRGSGSASLCCTAGLVVCTGGDEVGVGDSGEYIGGGEVGVLCSGEDDMTVDEFPSSQPSSSYAVEKHLRS